MSSATAKIYIFTVANTVWHQYLDTKFIYNIYIYINKWNSVIEIGEGLPPH